MRRVARGRRTRGEDRRTSLIAAIRVDLGRTIPIQRPTQTQGGRYFSVQLGGATGDGHAVHASGGSSPRTKRVRDMFQLPREKVQSTVCIGVDAWSTASRFDAQARAGGEPAKLRGARWSYLLAHLRDYSPQSKFMQVTPYFGSRLFSAIQIYALNPLSLDLSVCKSVLLF